MANNDNQNFNYEQLEAKELDMLRAQLRSFSTGIKGSLRTVQADQQLQDAAAAHSSHSDSDGWI